MTRRDLLASTCVKPPPEPADPPTLRAGDMVPGRVYEATLDSRGNITNVEPRFRRLGNI